LIASGFMVWIIIFEARYIVRPCSAEVAWHFHPCSKARWRRKRKDGSQIVWI
jgi:hypothetical protein